MEFNFDNNIPIYIQLVDYLKNYIISGKLQSGDKLPSVRDLAFQTKVNPNTMQRALTELEELGLIYTERTNGKFVTENKELIEQYKEENAKSITEKYFANMEQIGFNKNETIEYFKKFGGKC